MVSVNYWVEHQGSQSAMPDTSRMVHAIKGDRAGRPGIKFGGDRLHIVYISECAFAPTLWNVSCINRIHCLTSGGIFLSPIVRLVRLILVFTWRIPPLLFGIQLAGLLENPTLSVGVVCRFFGGAVNLT